MSRFTVFASPDEMGRAIWQVLDRNAVCDLRLFSTKAEAQAECDRRQAEVDQRFRNAEASYTASEFR